MKSSLLLTPLVTLLLATTLLADTISLRDGKELTGVVVEKETFKEVSYKKGRVNQTVASNDVRSISYGRTSKEYQDGMTALENGENLAAASNFLAAAEDEDLPDHVRASAYAETGDALLAANDYASALKYYDALLSTFKDTRHLARALNGRGKALFFMRDFAAAKEAFDKLASEASSKGLGQRWGLEGEFYSLWASEADPKTAKGKDFVAAYKALRDQAASVDPGLANRCALNMGRAYVRKNDVDSAERIFQEIIDKRLGTDAEVVAGAYNGRGECAFAHALAYVKDERRKSDAIDAFKEARLDFLRVYVSYKGVEREQPEALYMAGQCFLNLAAIDETETEAEFQGRVMLKRLKDGYPLSEQAKKVEGA
ncbi:MAG: tetratricopeptide repeat protein [Planctomycetes bacterium]|nr:tetratricopeptide repeat protein [Planctomycetota bacterium]